VTRSVHLLRSMADRLPVEDGVLSVSEDEVIAEVLAMPGDVTRVGDAKR
jgi:hypothetical protein